MMLGYLLRSHAGIKLGQIFANKYRFLAPSEKNASLVKDT
jgi:hypothetical protein